MARLNTNLELSEDLTRRVFGFLNRDLSYAYDELENGEFKKYMHETYMTAIEFLDKIDESAGRMWAKDYTGLLYRGMTEFDLDCKDCLNDCISKFEPKYHFLKEMELDDYTDWQKPEISLVEDEKDEVER